MATHEIEAERVPSGRRDDKNEKKAEEKVPPPTVREAMGFGGFAQAQLVAGQDGLDHPIEWVRVMESPETPVRVRPNELLLTTAVPLEDDAAAPLRVLESLHASGGSALVVKLGRDLGELPRGMAAEADRLNLPLFTIGPDVFWSDLMEPLLERIINAEHWRLKRSLEIHGRFTELVLDGKGVNEICRTLAELLDSAVSVEDASFHLLAHAGGARSDPHRRETIARHGTPPRVLYDPQIQSVLREVTEHRHPMKVPAFPHLGMHRGRIIAPILAANQLLGVISILDHPDNDELAFMAVEQAAMAMALAVTKEREVSEVEGRLRGEFLDDLVHGTYGDDASAERRARHVGYPLAGRHVLMVVDVDDFRGFLRTRQISEDAIQGVKREFLRRVSGVIRAGHSRALVDARSDSVMTLLPLGGDVPSDHSERLVSLGHQVRETVADWRPGFTVSVGLSAPVEAPGGVPTAYREVRAVMDTLARFKRWSQVVAVPELGLTGLLAGVSDERLVEFASRHLGTLVEHDRTRNGSLVGTLKAYLEEGEQQAAARRLRIHPNTLRYRLDRVREISGAELDDPETRLNLAVALRVQGLLGL